MSNVNISKFAISIISDYVIIPNIDITITMFSTTSTCPRCFIHPDSNFVMFIIAATSGRASINCSSSFNAGAVGSHFRV